MGYDTSLYEVEGAVATVTMNRPEVANAQNTALIDDLDAAFDEADADDAVESLAVLASVDAAPEGVGEVPGAAPGWLALLPGPEGWRPVAPPPFWPAF